MTIVYKPSSKEVVVQVVKAGAPPPKEVKIPSWAVGLALAGVVAAVVYASRRRG